jgi:hypothetical protein
MSIFHLRNQERYKTMKRTRPSIAAAAVIIIGLYILSSAGRKPPFIPHDALHGVITTQEACATCHAPGKQSPLKADHPPKEQCLVCHKPGIGKM